MGHFAFHARCSSHTLTKACGGAPASTLRTGQGVGALTIESVTVSGVAVPKSMIQELVAYYARSGNAPEGFNLEAPFRLPAKIREIRTARGQAVIVQ